MFLAIAVVATLLVLALLLRPLWRDARGIALGIAIVMLASTALLYRIVGTPQGIEAGNADMPETLDEAIVRLEAELQRHPEQVEGWRLLGMAYSGTNQPLKSRDAYAKAATLAPNDADVAVEAAQARALADDKRLFDAQAVALLQRALRLQPENQRARWFLGVAQRQRGDNAAAVATWEALLPRLQASTAEVLRKEIDAARKDAGMTPLPPVTSQAGALRVKIALDPAFAARVRLRGDATVFVIARAPEGPPMPVAVEKHAVSELPFTATVDDADSPMPTMKLSQMREVELVARLSESGIANKQEGDIESKPIRIALPATKPVELFIGSSQ